MTRYVTQYPHPGPRPAEEAEPATFTSDAIYKAWTERAAQMHDWQTKMRQHTVALALDDLMHELRLLPTGLEVPRRATMVVWLSYLAEPLPPEFFP